jgi:hypothetical protein
LAVHCRVLPRMPRYPAIMGRVRAVLSRENWKNGPTIDILHLSTTYAAIMGCNHGAITGEIDHETN